MYKTKAMKAFLISIFIIICIKSNAQMVELQGRYSASFLGAETINFVGTDSFYFSGFYCTNGVKGKGRCELLNGYLYLNFEKEISKKIDSLETDFIQKTIPKNDSVISIKVTCTDKKGYPIYGLSISCGNKGIACDNSGKGELKIKKAFFKNTVKISGIGFQEKIIHVSKAFDYDIKVVLKDGINEVLNKGEKYVYEIQEIAEDKIVMKKIKGGIFAGFVTYKKKN